MGSVSPGVAEDCEIPKAEVCKSDKTAKGFTGAVLTGLRQGKKTNVLQGEGKVTHGCLLG